MQLQENVDILPWLLLLIGLSIGVSWILKKQHTKKRLLKLSTRKLLEVDTVAELMVGTIQHNDREVAKKELIGLATALSVPAGLLRPDDIVEEIIGKDYFVGDAVLEIEKRLQHLRNKELNKLTVQQVICALMSNPQ